MVEQNNNSFNVGENREQIEKGKGFSPETRGMLEQRSCHIYTLTGKTMLQLSDEGVPISKEWTSIKNVDDEINHLRSRRSEVAIGDIALSPNRTLLSSFDKSVPEQIAMVENASDQLQRDVSGARMIIGNPVDYLELAWEIRKTIGRNLFETEYILPFLSRLLRRRFKQNWFTRTNTPLESVRGSFTFAVSFYGEEFHISAWPRQEGNHIMGALPLIVPTGQKAKNNN